MISGWTITFAGYLDSYDTECVVNSLRDLNIKVLDWELMTWYAEELIKRIERRNQEFNFQDQ